MEDQLLAQRAVELDSFIAAKVERCELLLKALKVLYPNVPILHYSKHFIELRDEYDAMLESEGVNINFKNNEKHLYPSPGVTFLEVPQEAKEQALLYHPGSEICGLYAYDFRLDQTQKCIAIHSKNIIKECDDVLNDIIQRRSGLLKYAEGLPVYFNWVRENDYRKVIALYKNLT